MELARESVAKFKNAYIANLLLAYDQTEKKEFNNAIGFYKNALSLAPQSEKIIAELVFLFLSVGNLKDTLIYSRGLSTKLNIINSKIGILFLSSKARRLFIFFLLMVLSFIYPYALYILSPFLMLFCADFIFGKIRNNRLAIFVSTFFVYVILGAILFCLLYYGSSQIQWSLYEALLRSKGY